MEQMRSEFEAWYLDNMKKNAPWAANYTIEEVERLRGKDGEYTEYGYTSGCWQGWKAGHAAGLRVKEK